VGLGAFQACLLISLPIIFDGYRGPTRFQHLGLAEPLHEGFRISRVIIIENLLRDWNVKPWERLKKFISFEKVYLDRSRK